MSRFNTPISGKRNEKGLMQIEVFPLRVLNVETAQKLIDELNKIDGITRMVVHGPRLPRENPDDLLEGKFGATDKKYLNIKGEQVELTVQVGRIWIEITDTPVIEQVRAAAEKTLPFPFEMYEGVYIRTKKTLSDYVRKGGNVDDISVGLFDPKAKARSSCCSTKGD
ncbi:methyl-coenzyme M reductase operon protein D [Methanocella arvoryzae]|uniref:Methyl-coenzyme M reductase operon protein D n=1 Tax=Methanocella arvoryzae (strain DSM 22066 / NBRC 105507 / MRE50) TaxID=351160 RepID=Q0W5P0_METAR|nr:methyl-coenzyme M reductase operon protein D [Methanocella arvoryzae]CAJ36303.1 methyl-coenzyme M reductase operon protein D [Methanocella arvoryzae MRE50]